VSLPNHSRRSEDHSTGDSSGESYLPSVHNPAFARSRTRRRSTGTTKPCGLAWRKLSVRCSRAKTEPWSGTLPPCSLTALGPKEPIEHIGILAVLLGEQGADNTLSRSKQSATLTKSSRLQER
jgi:hypothetical protein